MESYESFVELFVGLDIPTANTYCLVLTAVHIEHRSFRDLNGWCILVRPHQLSTAKEQIDAYLKENPSKPVDSSFLSMEVEKNHSMIWIAVVLIAIHWAIGIGIEKQTIIRHLGASSEGILKGELFRCITALTLHSNVGHLAANLGGLLLLGTILCRIMGTGVGWGLILFGGGGGNFLNALVHKSAHLSIGASTSVFSILGSLSALSLLQRIRTSDQRVKRLLPLGGGIALLAFMGANPKSDVLAHLFGFIVGFFLALLWVWMFPIRLTSKSQWVLSAISIGIMAVAWTVGLSRS
ncbi:MAG: rhomboid family intramembrane serine protease [Desulfobacteraceae bacterium]|jgi:membrane associated rhomboid family serine protease